ncbi:hypothetical protein GGS21DRAFT_411678 [Xylaria nigripes]|nr:hypothetical protein GGS21DRAFT_411678 [Xylaria nigripes]
MRTKPGKANTAKLHAKLNEAAPIHAKDRGTVACLVMQSLDDPQDFTIVERYEDEESQKYHLENPYWKAFEAFIVPLLEGAPSVQRFNELAPFEGEEALLK